MKNIKKYVSTTYQNTMDFCHKSKKSSKSCADFFEHPHGYFLPHKFTQKLHGAIMDGLYDIEPNLKYSLKDVCGKDYWKSLSKQERRIAHSCVDYLIKYENLPLQLEECNGEKKYFYHVDFSRPK